MLKLSWAVTVDEQDVHGRAGLTRTGMRIRSQSIDDHPPPSLKRVRNRSASGPTLSKFRPGALMSSSDGYAIGAGLPGHQAASPIPSINRVGSDQSSKLALAA